VRASRERLGEAVLGQDAPEGAYVVLEVADTGCGMDAATQRRIFEPFYSSKFAGRGLGLPAVLGIVRQLAGAIEVESAPGSGARFRVLLPAAEAAGVASAAPPEQDSEPWTGEGLVLVVDDDASVRKVAERSLVRLGFDVLEAEGGAQAVELYRRHRWLVRAVLLDLTMPHLDGVETLRLLREVDPDVFVIVASGHATAEVMARFRAAPPAAHVQKPFGIEQLRRLLRAAPPRRGPGASAG
jgi:CheY-like chemotaxis protein